MNSKYFHAGLGLSAVGFGLYLKRQVREAWAGGSWQIVVLVAYLSSFGHAPWHMDRALMEFEYLVHLFTISQLPTMILDGFPLDL